MSTPNNDVQPERWLRVSELAQLEGITRREVYAQIDRGMPHSRIGDRIRVRRRDWHDWHEQHLIGGAA